MQSPRSLADVDLAIMRAAVAGPADPSIVHAEAALRVAQLTGDVGALDQLIHDDLLFTGPDGRLVSKAEDLALHTSRAVRFLEHVPHTLSARVVGRDVVSTALRARLTLMVHETRIEGVFCYTRAWAQEAAGLWRVVAGHVSAAPPEPPR